MIDNIYLQGRSLSADDIDLIQNLIRQNPDWNRTRLSRHLCALWHWQDSAGRTKDMACRTMLLKLHRRGLIQLPPRQKAGFNHCRGRSFQPVLHDTCPLQGTLQSLGTIRLIIADNQPYRDLWQTLLCCYHYLGFKTCVGKSIRYLALDDSDRPLGALLFGAAAWKCAARDNYIGWSATARAQNLERIVNNMRFLIPPWISVEHLASHLLGLSLRLLPKHWMLKYKQPPLLAETFVESERFNGTCYKAANWQHVGWTTGRTRQDRYNCIREPIKQVYVYPLCPKFRTLLSQEVA